MIDIHSHILPNIDDGSENMEMSLAMLRTSVASGVTDIIATPHVNRHGVIPAWQTIEEKAEELKRAAQEQQIPIRIHTGAEIEFNGDVMRFLEKGSRDYCLAGSPYVLLEFTDQTQPDIAEHMLFALQLRGFWPVLAHIERFPQILADKERLLSWAEKGILYQCNAGSFTGYFGPKCQTRVEELYHNGLIHFLGSDGHRVEFRTTDLREAHEVLDKLAAKEKKESLWQQAEANAQFILKGRVLYPDVPQKWQKKKKGFFSRLFG
ncbi:tyrosine-protein phosphatase [Mitsuokella sp. WILCCON 0060]|uniref:tyrosine-protein phosphatase n=1 Tax=Mitsuokella sp. WILCCON 0060 TaxID=3345341 RepID=UPI003F1B8272